MATLHYVDNDDLTCWVERHQHDAAAAESLAMATARIAEGIYKRYARPPMDPEDLSDFAQQCALLAPHWAVRFKPELGSKAFNYLTTCVCNCFRQHVRDEAVRLDRLHRYQQLVRDTR